MAPKWCALLNNRLVFIGVGVRNCSAGLNIGNDPDSVPSGIRIDGIQRGDWDREGAIRWAQAAAAAKSPQVKETIDELLDTKEFD